MRFTQLALTNFRSHKSTTLDFAKLTVVRAPNATGKSSIEQAIQLAITNRANGTSSDGKGSINLIRAGESKAAIDLTISSDGKERRIQAALNGTAINRIATDPTNEQWGDGPAFLEKLKLGKDVFSCLLNNRHFITQSEDEQKNILSAIILPKSYDWPEWVKPMAASLGLSISWGAAPFEVIAQGYKLAFAARTDINRDLKNFVMPTGETDGADDYEEVTAKVKERRNELENAVKAQAAANAGATQAASLLSASKTRKAEAEARMEREARESSRLDNNLLSKPKHKEHTETAKKSDRAKELDALIASTEIDIRQNKEAKAKISALDGTPKCPTCHSDITDDLIQALMVPLVTAYNTLTASLRAAQDERKAIGDPSTSQRLLDEHAKALKDQESAKGRIKDEEKIIADADRKIAEAEAAAKPAADETLAAKITDLRDRIARGEEMERKCKAAADLVKRIEEAKVKRETLTKKSADVERMVKYFDATGVKAELLSASLEPFTASVNEVLSEWGYTATLSIEPYLFAITFKGEDGKDYPIAVKNLSGSQRAGFSVAFQVALAKFSGWGFVVVDGADVFFGDKRGGLFSALYGADLDQVVVLIADDRVNVPASADGDSAFYLLGNTSAEGMIPTTTVKRLGA